jgi:hypothetical protein
VLGRAGEAVIPAAARVREGDVVPDRPGGEGMVAFMHTAPAGNFYRNMTEPSPTMPVFVNQVI